MRLLTNRRRALEASIPIGVGLGLALAIDRRLLAHLGSSVTGLGDPLVAAWQIAWTGHAVLHEPMQLWQSNAFWPLNDSLAFNDAIVGYAPAGMLATGPSSALLVYNLVFLFAGAFAFVGAYLLARELGTGRLGGLCAGAVFAYAPWRLGHEGHLSIISSGGIPFALFLLLRGYRRRSAWTVAAGWLVAAWQTTLGWTLGLMFTYLLCVLALIAGVAIWRRRHQIAVSRRLVFATAAGVCLLALVTAVHARPYLRVIHDHPEGKRSYAYVASLSPTWRGLFAAPERSDVWGSATAGPRAHLTAAPIEQTLFPGATVVLLALVGVFAPSWPRRRRAALAVGTAACAVLSLGLPSPSSEWRFVAPYRLLFEFAPGWDGIRTPGRIHALTTLGLALLAAAGLAFLVRRLAEVVRRRAVVVAVGLGLVAAIVAEGWGPIYAQHAPGVPAGQQTAAAPLLHLPPDVSDDYGRYHWWSIGSFKPMVNGYGSFDPTWTAQLIDDVAGFPDRSSVVRLRRVGVRTVILHRDFAVGTRWAAVANRPVKGLPLTRETRGELVIYRLG